MLAVSVGINYENGGGLTVTKRKTRIQRLENQLRKARRDIVELQEISEIQSSVILDLGNRLSLLAKAAKTDIARVSNSIRVTNVWSKALQYRVYRLEQGFWKRLFSWRPRKVTKDA